MKNKVVLFIAFIAVSVSCLCAVAVGDENTRLLARIYFTFQVYQQAENELGGILGNATADQAAQIKEVFQNHFSRKVQILRSDLEKAFGDNAQARLQTFCTDYEKAEHSADLEYLSVLVSKSGLKSKPGSYDLLRKAIVAEFLDEEINGVSALLGQIQEWQEQKSANPGVSDLVAWIKQSEQPVVVVKKRVDLLESAEASPAPFVADENDAASVPLDDLASLRDARRKKALEEAKDSMQQIASERAAAEAEYAARKQSAAQAEAENMKRQADRIVAANQEAINQKQKSFGNRLKNVVSATIGAAVGTFTGAVGARAGQAAVDAIFGSSAPPAYVPVQPGTQPIQPVP